jgi:hypothetical protein
MPRTYDRYADRAGAAVRERPCAAGGGGPASRAHPSGSSGPASHAHPSRARDRFWNRCGAIRSRARSRVPTVAVRTACGLRARSSKNRGATGTAPRARRHGGRLYMISGPVGRVCMAWCGLVVVVPLLGLRIKPSICSFDSAVENL